MKLQKRKGYSIRINAEGIQSEHLDSIEEYNDKNNIVSSVCYDESGSIIEKNLFQYYDNDELQCAEVYDENNDLIQKTEYVFETESGTTTKREIITYQDGTKDEYIVFYQNNLVSKTEKYINTQPEESEEYIYENGTLHTYRKLNADNNEIERRVYNREDNEEHIEMFSNGELINTVTIVYDNGRVVEKYFDDGLVIIKEAYVYDSNGNETEINSYQDETLVGTACYEYDASNNLIKETQTYQGDAQSRQINTVSTYAYDDRNRIILQQNNNGIIRYEYE